MPDLQSSSAGKKTIHSVQQYSPAQNIDLEMNMQQCRINSAIRICRERHGLPSTNVMMFNDWDWLSFRTDPQSQLQETWMQQMHRPMVIELVASKAILSVRHFNQRILTAFSGRLIRINPRERQVPTPLDIGLTLCALSELQAIDKLFGG